MHNKALKANFVAVSWLHCAGMVSQLVADCIYGVVLQSYGNPASKDTS